MTFPVVRPASGRLVSGFVLAIAAGLAAGPVTGQAVRGELCFPLEGWSIVGHWHVGSAARSCREGWGLPGRIGTGWTLMRPGAAVPESVQGAWIRNRFTFRRSRWRNLLLEFEELDPRARVLLNGVLIEGAGPGVRLDLAPFLRKGANHLSIVLPACGKGEVTVPKASLWGETTGGRVRLALKFREWEFQKEMVEAGIPPSWLKGGDTTAWRTTVPVPPDGHEAWLARAPYCLKAVIDVPSYWRGRPLTAFLHGIPGEPEVWVNGTRVVERLRTPARVDLGNLLKLNGFDTVCLVYDRPPDVPPGNAAPPGEPRGGGVVAVHWETWVPRPRVPQGSTVWYELGIGADTPGIGNALAYASEILKTGSTPFDISWAPLGTGGPSGSTACAVLTAIWSGSPFTSSGLAAAEAMVKERIASVTARHWVMTPPTAGSRRDSGANQRLALFTRRITAAAEERHAGLVPVYQVFQSALRSQRRWPARPEFSGASGDLTPQGSYLAALAVIEGLSLHRD